jgi:hypothetical protein
MLWTMAVVLTILCLLGRVSGYTMEGFIHPLLTLGVVEVPIRITQERLA